MADIPRSGKMSNNRNVLVDVVGTAELFFLAVWQILIDVQQLVSDDQVGMRARSAASQACMRAPF